MLYPGHDYIANNLKFTLDREPDNSRAGQLLAQVAQQDPHTARLTTLAKDVFIRLRELRNSW